MMQAGSLIIELRTEYKYKPPLSRNFILYAECNCFVPRRTTKEVLENTIRQERGYETAHHSHRSRSVSQTRRPSHQPR